MKKNILTYLVLAMISCASDNLVFSDYRLFKNSPVSDVAEAIRRGDMERLRESVVEHKTDLDYQETKFGATVLMLTVINQHYEACQLLLEAGANPNLHDNFDGTSAIILAAGIERPSASATRFIELLLSFNANPNDVEIGDRRTGNTTRKTPLISACQNITDSPIEKVKILVEAGADINFTNEYNVSALRTAVTFEHYDVVLYLLRNGAKYDALLSNNAGREWYLWDKMRLSLFPLGSKKHKEKMLVADFLKEKGIEYDNVSIPPYAIEEAKKLYPSGWEEYLKKY